MYGEYVQHIYLSTYLIYLSMQKNVKLFDVVPTIALPFKGVLIFPFLGCGNANNCQPHRSDVPVLEKEQ